MQDLKLVVERRNVLVKPVVEQAEKGQRGDKGEAGQRGPAGIDVSERSPIWEQCGEQRDYIKTSTQMV